MSRMRERKKNLLLQTPAVAIEAAIMKAMSNGKD